MAMMPLAVLGGLGAYGLWKRKQKNKKEQEAEQQQQAQQNLVQTSTPTPSTWTWPTPSTPQAPAGQVPLSPYGMPSFMDPAKYGWSWTELDRQNRQREAEANAKLQGVTGGITPEQVRWAAQPGQPKSTVAGATQTYGGYPPVYTNAANTAATGTPWVPPPTSLAGGTLMHPENYTPASRARIAELENRASGYPPIYTNAAATTPKAVQTTTAADGTPIYQNMAATTGYSTPPVGGSISQWTSEPNIPTAQQQTTLNQLTGNPILTALLGGLVGQRLGDPLTGVGMGLGLGQTQQETVAGREAAQASREQAQLGENQYLRIMGMMPYVNQALREQATGQYGDLLSQQRSLYGDYESGVMPRYDQRTADVMGLLEDYGSQQQRDIRRDYENLASQQNAQLAARGLSGGSMATGAGLGRMREQQAAAQRAAEQAAALKASTLGGLTGEAAAAAERTGRIGYGDQMQILTNQANTMNQMTQAEWDQELQNMYNLIGWWGGIQHQYPQMQGVNNLMGLISGKTTAEAYQAPDSGIWPAAIGATGNVAAATSMSLPWEDILRASKLIP